MNRAQTSHDRAYAPMTQTLQDRWRKVSSTHNLQVQQHHASGLRACSLGAHAICCMVVLAGAALHGGRGGAVRQATAKKGRRVRAHAVTALLLELECTCCSCRAALVTLSILVAFLATWVTVRQQVSQEDGTLHNGFLLVGCPLPPALRQ